MSPRLHGWGLLGGLIWAIGTLSNLVSGKTLSFALSYALGQTAPVVAVLWGLLWYHEFDGAPRKAVAYLVAMFFFFSQWPSRCCASGAIDLARGVRFHQAACIGNAGLGILGAVPAASGDNSAEQRFGVLHASQSVGGRIRAGPC